MTAIVILHHDINPTDGFVSGLCRVACAIPRLTKKPTVWYVPAKNKRFPPMSPLVFAYAALAMAIICEVTATTLLQKSEQFTRMVPTGGMVLFYVLSFYLLSHSLKVLPLGVAYAVWCGFGIILTAGIGVFVLKQPLDFYGMLGIAMILGGVVVMNLLSKTAGHS